MPNKKDIATKSGSEHRIPPEALKPTDWAILKHVWLYHFTIPHAIEKLFFPSDLARAGTVLDALARQGFLKNRNDTKANLSAGKKTTTNRPKAMSTKKEHDDGVFRIGSVKFYVLGPSCEILKRYGFRPPKGRTDPIGGEQSFITHLAALWYCLFDGPRRYRLDEQELQATFQNPLPEGKKLPHQCAYCIAPEEDGPVIYRVYPCTKEDIGQVPIEIARRLIKDQTNLGLGPWIDSGQYGYAVMLDSEERKADAERAVEREKKKNEMLAKARITLNYAPHPELLSRALRQHGHIPIQTQPKKTNADRDRQERPTTDSPA